MHLTSTNLSTPLKSAMKAPSIMIPPNSVVARRVATSLRLYASVAVAFFFVGQQTFAQTDTADPGVESIPTRFVPDDAIVLVDLHPPRLLESPNAWFLPTEVLEAWFDQNVGLKPDNVRAIRVVVPMPGQGPPRGGGLVVFKSPVSMDDLKPGLVDVADPVSLGDGIDAFPITSTNGEMLIHAASSTLWVIGTPSYLPEILQAAGDGESRLLNLAETVPRGGFLQAVLDFEAVSPMASMAVAANMQNLPPWAARLPEIIPLIAGVTTSVKPTLSDLMTYGSWTLHARDEAAAERIEQILAETVEAGAAELVPQMLEGLTPGDPVSDAMRAYILRIEGRVVPMLRLRRQGSQLTMPPLEMQNVAVGGVLVGLLLPAVQAAREAARRMTASNNLKQIGLAMHNYHATYNRLPPRAITDAEGNPLLSWRVSLLPFLEQQALYDQFHLDEPWDSPHNLPLSEIVVPTYVDPSAAYLGNRTVFSSPDGAETMLGEVGQDRSFADIRDGVSNTLMVVEVAPEQAVVWSQPEDVTLLPTDPLADTGSVHQGGFHVVMGDGAVKFITNSINTDMFNALVTPNGREVINP